MNGAYDHLDKLWQISIVQRKKANHNDLPLYQLSDVVVANINSSKKESKSQPTTFNSLLEYGCGKYQ